MYSYFKGQKKGETIHVWDADFSSLEHDGTVILWSAFTEKENEKIISLPKFVEENAISLRSRYLAWIYELGETEINGKSVVDHFEIRSGFSYWWLTLLSEKSIFKSPQIFNVIKLFAFEDISNVIKPEKIVLTTANKKMASIFKKWCSKTKVEFELKLLNKKKGNISVTLRIYRSLPHTLLAILGLIRHVVQKFPFPKKHKESTNNADITFIDYFINLAPDSVRSGVYISNYWTELLNVLRHSKISTNWFHIYIPHDDLITPSAAKVLMSRFDTSSGKKEHHEILDGVISFKMAYRIFTDYYKIVRTASRLKQVQKYFLPSNSSLNLWDLYEDEWIQGTRGTITMASLINFNLFENVFSEIKIQKLGFYLFENQNWEKALIYAWKKNGHKRLIGVAHSTVRFWDLRYFQDPRAYQKKGHYPMPMPDQVAINGPAAMNEYKQGQYPLTQLIEVEALRYFHLIDNINKSKNHKSSSRLKILVCGDIDSEASRKMLQWLEEIFNQLPHDTTITVKSHPAQEIFPEKFPGLPFITTRESLGNILHDYDVVYASYITSAAVDAYCSGIPVIQVLDGAAFNMSALRGLKAATFVKGPKELAHALKSFVKEKNVSPKSFFYLNNELTRWRGVLSQFIHN